MWNWETLYFTNTLLLGTLVELGLFVNYRLLDGTIEQLRPDVLVGRVGGELSIHEGGVGFVVGPFRDEAFDFSEGMREIGLYGLNQYLSGPNSWSAY